MSVRRKEAHKCLENNVDYYGNTPHLMMVKDQMNNYKGQLTDSDIIVGKIT